jgi:hypothetical protein
MPCSSGREVCQFPIGVSVGTGVEDRGGGDAGALDREAAAQAAAKRASKPNGTVFPIDRRFMDFPDGGG